MGLSADEMLCDAYAGFYDDPLGYVMFNFPWDAEKDIQKVRLPDKYADRFRSLYGPDLWACEFLEQLGDEIKLRKFDGVKLIGPKREPMQFSTASGHGIGKSVLVALLTKFIMDTRPMSKGIITAGGGDQLRTRTWAELGKWHRISLSADWFNWTGTRANMALVHREFPEWRVDGYTCKEENKDNFQGLHASGGTPFYIFDEASAVPDGIFEVREGGLTDGEPMVFDFGNPTKNSGRFFEDTVGKFKHRFITRQIDSRSVFITNKDDIQRKLEDHGEDSDYFKVRVRGVFPSLGLNQFIATSDVEDAMIRPLPDTKYSPLILGVDVAGSGTDECVIYPRLGMDARTWLPDRFSTIKADELIDRIIAKIKLFESLGHRLDALFMDTTGIGAPVAEMLDRLGYSCIKVNFGSRSNNPIRYRLKCDEIWGNMKDAIERGLCLPSLPGDTAARLKDQLIQREFEYTVVGNKIQLESKRDMKSRGLDSPDIADALAVTFAYEVNPNMHQRWAGQRQQVVHDFDPFEALRRD